eukprot:6736089-Pyramimonas_sp.AAC.1
MCIRDSGHGSWKPTILMMKTFGVDWSSCFELEAKRAAKLVIAERKRQAHASEGRIMVESMAHSEA